MHNKNEIFKNPYERAFKLSFKKKKKKLPLAYKKDYFIDICQENLINRDVYEEKFHFSLSKLFFFQLLEKGKKKKLREKRIRSASTNY